LDPVERERGNSGTPKAIENWNGQKMNSGEQQKEKLYSTRNTEGAAGTCAVDATNPKSLRRPGLGWHRHCSDRRFETEPPKC